MKSAFKTFLVVIICLVCLSNSVKAQTSFVVPQGGIAVIGYDFDNNKFSFVCLTQIPTGTIILFTDKGWSSTSDSFRSEEGILYWINGCDLGETIIVNNQDENFPVYENNSSFSLSNGGDQIFVYQENLDGTPHLIFGLNSDGIDWLPFDQSQTNNSSNLPDSLASDPYAAIAIPEKDRGYYHGTKSFKTTSAALTAIINVDNWTTADSNLTIPAGNFSFETTAVELSQFDAKSGNETPPLWVLFALVIVPVVFLFFKRPKRDCCR